MNRDVPWTIAAGYFSPYLILVLLNESTVIKVRRHRFRRGPQVAHLRDLMARFVKHHRLDTMVIEARTAAQVGLTAPKEPLRTLAVATAKERLYGKSNITHEMLFGHLVTVHPDLRRFIKVLANGRIAQGQARQRLTLLVAALGLAAPP